MIGVVCVNFLFTYPYWALNFTLADYPVTFIGMLAIFFITSAAATRTGTASGGSGKRKNAR
jgi:two-component system sensor histidine kinase KdpD